MIGREAGKSYAYLLGVYLGDGCVTTQAGKRVFKVNTIDEDFALAIKAALENVSTYKVGICKYEVNKSNKPNYTVRSGDLVVCALLTTLCDYKQSLPMMIGWDAGMKKAFIVGLMDSEGFVAEKTENKTGRAYYMGFKSCDRWVRELIGLMQSVGLQIGKLQTEKPQKQHYKAPTRFHIKMQSWVDSGMRFNIKRKQDRVDRWAATEPYSERSRYPRKLTSETSTLEARKG